METTGGLAAGVLNLSVQDMGSFCTRVHKESFWWLLGCPTLECRVVQYNITVDWDRAIVRAELSLSFLLPSCGCTFTSAPNKYQNQDRISSLKKGIRECISSNVSFQ